MTPNQRAALDLRALADSDQRQAECYERISRSLRRIASERIEQAQVLEGQESPLPKKTTRRCGDLIVQGMDSDGVNFICGRPFGHEGHCTR